MLRVLLLVLSSLSFAAASSSDITCANIDWIYSNSQCCDETNVAKCVKKIPHQDYNAHVAQLEGKLANLGLCNDTEPECIVDFPDVKKLIQKIDTIVESGLEIAVELAKSSQPRNENLDAISNGTLPDGLVVQPGSVLKFAESAVLDVDNFAISKLVTGATESDKAEIDFLHVENVVSPQVDFHGNTLSNLNIQGSSFTIDNEPVLASAAEINVLQGIDLQLTAAELNKLVGLEVDAEKINLVNGLNASLDTSNLNLLDGLDIEEGNLNVLKGVDPQLSSTEFNRLVGLTATASELNILDGVDTSLGASELNLLSGLETASAQLNILKDVDTNLDKTELNQLVGLDINAGDLNVLKGVSSSLSKTELDKLVGLTSTSSELNVLDGVNTDLGASELNLLPGLETASAQLNILKDVDTNLGKTELDQLVGLDINAGDLNVLKGVSSSLSKTELDKIVGLTATASELNVLDGVNTALGATELNLLPGLETAAAQLNILKDVDTNLDKTELDQLVGLDINAGDLNVLKGVSSSLSKTELDKIVGLTASASELNILDGVNTALGATELNLLPGLETAAAQLNILKDVSTDLDKTELDMLVGLDINAGDLNVLKGVNSSLSKTELDKLVGLTVDAVALNQLESGTGKILSSDVTSAEFDLINDIQNIGKTEPLKAVTTDASGNVVFSGDVEIDGSLDIPLGELKLNGIALRADLTADVINNAAEYYNALNASTEEINTALDGIQASAVDLNKLNLMTATTEELNRLDITTVGSTEPNKVVTTDANGDVQFNGKVTMDDVLDVKGTLKIDSVNLTSSAAELNILDGVSTDLTVDEINMLDLSSESPGVTENSKVVTADSNGHVTFSKDVTVTETLKVSKDKLLINNVTVTATAAEINTLDGINVGLTNDELNILDGLNASTEDLNVMLGTATAGVTPNDVKMLAGVSQNIYNNVSNRALVTDGSGNVRLATLDVGEIDIPSGKLKINGTVVSASASELNLLKDISTSLKTSELNLLEGVTSSAAELNLLDGVVVSTNDLNALKDVSTNALNDQSNRVVVTDANGDLTLQQTTVVGDLSVGKDKIIIDGVAMTSSAAEINKLDGLSTTKAELDILHGITVSTAEINSLSGIESSADDINLLQGTATDRSNASPNRAVVMKADGSLSLPNKTDANVLRVNTLQIDGQEVTATATELNVLDGITATTTELNIFSGATVSTAEINILDGVTSSTTDLNLLSGLASDRTNNNTGKVLVMKDTGDISIPQKVEAQSVDVTDTFKIAGLEVTATATELNSLSGLTADATELNILDGVTATTADLNKLETTATKADLEMLAGVDADRTNSVADKAVVLDSNGDLNIAKKITASEADVSVFKISGTTVQVTSELNTLDGLESTTAELNILNGVTASATEINVMDGVTASTSDLNLLKGLATSNRLNDVADRAVVLKSDGTLDLHHDVRIEGTLSVDALKINDVLLNVTALELNTLNGLLANVDELNIMDGVTASTSEINILDGLTSTTSDLNMLQGTGNTHANDVASRAVVLDSSKTLHLPNLLNATEIDVDTLKIDSVEVTATATEINVLDGIAIGLTAEELSLMDGVTATTAEINIMDGVTASTADINTVAGLASSSANDVAGKVVVLDSSGNLALPGDTTFTGDVDITTLKIDSVEVTSTAAELNIMDGVTATTAEINVLSGAASATFKASDLDVLHGFLGSTTDLNRLYAVGDCKYANGTVLNHVKHEEDCDETWVLGSTKASKAVITDSSGNVQFNGDISASGTLDLSAHTASASKFKLGGVPITVNASDVNLLSDVTATAAEINKLAVTTEGQTEASKAVIMDANGDIEFNGDVKVSGTADVKFLTYQGVNVTATPAEINQLSQLDNITIDRINEFNGLSVTASQLNKFDDVSATKADLDKLSTFTVTPSQVSAFNAVESIGKLEALSNLENFISLDANNDVSVQDIEVKGTLKVGSTTVSESGLSQCANFVQVGNACTGSYMHILVDGSSVKFCKADNSAILIS